MSVLEALPEVKRDMFEILLAAAKDESNNADTRVSAAIAVMNFRIEDDTYDFLGVTSSDAQDNDCVCETPKEMPFPFIRVEARYCSPGCDKQRRYVYVNDIEVGQVCPNAPSFELVLQDLVRRAIAVDRRSR